MFYLQLAIAFFVGGLFIALQTLLGERVRLAWRGIVLTIPSTIALGLFFIGLTKTSQDVVHAAIIGPAGSAPAFLFIMVFAILAKRGFWQSLLAGAVAWVASSALLLKFPPPNFLISVLYEVPVLILSYVVISLLPQKHTLKKFPLNAKHIIGRSVFAGFIITLATLLAKTLGNTWGGLFSVFPAVFSSTFIIFYFLQGPEVIPAVAKSLFFPGSIGLVIYGGVAILVFPKYGIWLGTLISYGAHFTFTYLYYLIHKHIKHIDAEVLPS